MRIKAQLPPAGDAGPAGGRGHERHRARRRPGDRAGLPPPDRAGREGRGLRAARGHPRAAARGRRRRADHPDARHPGRVHEGAGPGAAAQAGRRAGDRHRRRAGRHAGGDAGQGPRVDRGQPGRRAALGQAGLPGPRRHAEHPEAGRRAAGVPGQPAQAAQGRPAAGAAQHPGRGRRGHPGRHRDRVPDRGPLLHRAGLRAGLQEHDQGVLLRPAAHQRRRLPPGRLRALAAAQGGRARRRDDGRRDRLQLRAGRLAGRAQGRVAGGGRARQGLLGEAGGQGGQARQHHAGGRGGAAGAHHADRRLQRPGRLRPDHRGGVRVGGAQAGRLPAGDEDRRAGRAALLEHLHAADHRAGRRAWSGPATSSACTSSRRSTRCRWWRSSVGSGPGTPRWPRRST